MLQRRADHHRRSIPGPPALDKATHTLYAPDGSKFKFNEVAVLNAFTCNATNHSGCSQTPVQVQVGKGTFVIALSKATDTVYAAASGFGSGDTVAVINGATCNATDHSGCAHPVATVKVGLDPIGLDVNDKTHTVYVANNADGDLPGTVSLINSATCNGSHTAGCAGAKPTAPVGRSPLLVAVDAATDTAYVTNFSSASVSVLNGAKCRAGHTKACAKAVRQQPVGSQPYGLAIDQATSSVYVSDTLAPGALSIFKTSP